MAGGFWYLAQLRWLTGRDGRDRDLQEAPLGTVGGDQCWLDPGGGRRAAGACAARVSVRPPTRFVPGFGLEPQSQIRAALPHAVEMRRDGLTVVVTGLLATPTATTIDLAISGNSSGWMASPLAAILRDASGNRYRANGFGGSFGSTTAAGFITFGPLRARTRVLVLSVTGTRAPRVRLPLVGATALARSASVGRGVTRQGVTLAALDEAAGPYRFVAVVTMRTPPGTRPGGMEPAGQHLRLVSARGHATTLSQVDQTARGATTYRVPATAPAATLRAGVVSVPAVALQTGADATVEVPVPTHGSMVLDRRLRVGPAQVVLRVVQRMPNGDIRLRFAYPDAIRLGDPGMLYLDRQPYAGQTTEYMTDRDGSMSWLEITPPSGASAVDLGLNGPTLVVVGPWRLPLGTGRADGRRNRP